VSRWSPSRVATRATAITGLLKLPLTRYIDSSLDSSQPRVASSGRRIAAGSSSQLSMIVCSRSA
jgi:hypothetical protein